MRNAFRLLSLLMLGLLTCQAAEPVSYSPTPEQRVAKREAVRAADAAWAARKAKEKGLVIVEQGQPKATIVATGDDAKAAKVLQSWVKLMSGAELPIAAEKPAAGPAIYIGQAAIAAGCSVADIPSKSNEAIRVKCDGQNVFLAAPASDVSIRAVARFLENEFGCRWFADTDWGKHYPESPTLSVLTHEFSEAPTFTYRRLWGAEGAFRDNTWLAWAGHGGTGISMGHSWGFLPKETFKTNPEWYRLDENGQRVEGHWYNIGHPEVRKRFKEWALAASNQGNSSLSYSPPDDHREDFSPESMAYDNPKSVDPSSNRVSMTDRFMTIVNESAQELYKLNPKSVHGFYAYSDYTLPPTKPELDKLSPNLCIWIAPIRYSRYHPLNHPNSPSQQLLQQVVDGWSERATMLGWRTYNYNLAEVMTPYSRLSIWAYDLPYLLSRGCVGISLESFNTWEITGPHLYQSIELSYNPKLDPWLMMADYWDKAYGPAAVPMENYWMEVDAAVIGLKTETGSYHALHHVHTPERLARLDGYLKEAEALVAKGTANQQYRVNLARRGWQRGSYWRQWYDAINTGDIAKVESVYNAWATMVDESLKLRHTNVYSKTYLNRFIGGNTWNAIGAVMPFAPKVKKGEAPLPRPPANKLLTVLPDLWRTATGDELKAAGVTVDPIAADFNDKDWKPIKTWSDTRNAQGFGEYFGDMWYRTTFKAPASRPELLLHCVKADRKLTVWINGKLAGAEDLEAFKGATVDATGLITPGAEHQITVRVRHIPLPELFLGGLVHPIYLIEKAPPAK